jgi:hypothetical protein
VIRFRDRKRSKHREIEEGEDGSVDAYSKGQAQYSKSSEAGRLEQHAQAEVKVLREILEPIHATRFADAILIGLDAAEFDASAPRGFVARKARPNEIVRARFDVEAHLIIKLALESRAMAQTLPERTESSEHRQPS